MFEKIYLNLAEQLPINLIVSDLEGNIKFTNKRLVELMGSPSIEEILQINLLNFPKLIEIGVSDKIKNCINNKKENIFDVNYITKWGKEVWIKVNLAPLICDKHMEGVLIVIDDLKDIIGYEKKEDLADSAKTKFLSNISHEIRTPINGIMGFLQMLKSTPLNEEQTEYLNWMKSATDSLLRVINNVLDMSKINLGKIKIIEQEFYPNKLINECVEIMASRASYKKIKLNNLSNIEKNKKVKGDSLRIQQIIVNLLENAIKFTEKGEVSIFADIKNNDKKFYLLELLVEDTGIGIEKEQLEKVFVSFEQCDLSLTKKYAGIGLGLTICRALLEIMNGNISVESEVAKGTKVRVLIPLSKINL